MSTSALDCEVLTDYGWGYVREIYSQSGSEDGRIVIDLEGFEGWDSRKVPTLYSYAGEKAFVARSQSKLGSYVKTTHGVGVLIDYRRGEDEHIVRIIPSPSGSSEDSTKEGILLNLKREEILGAVENFDGVSQDYLTAQPIIEAIYAAMPDLDSGLLNQHPFEFFVTILMQVMNTSDFFPGLTEGEGDDTDNIKELSEKITNFDLNRWVAEGNDLVARLHGEGFAKDKVEAFETYWSDLVGAFDDIQIDVQLLIKSIGSREMGDLDVDEFVCKLYVHLGAARKLFDDNGAIADELSEEVSKILANVSGSLVESFNALKLLIDERFQATQVYEKFAQSKFVRKLLEGSNRLQQRTMQLFPDLPPLPSFDSSNMYITSLDDAEIFLERIVEYSETIKPLLKAAKGSESSSQIDVVGVSSATYFDGEGNVVEQISALAPTSSPLDSGSDLDIGGESAVESVSPTTTPTGGLASIFSSTAFASTFEMFKIEDFKRMIEKVVVGIAASNPSMSAYQLRKVLLVDQSGFMVLMTYLYNISTNTDLLDDNPIVAAIESSIPGPVVTMIKSLTESKSGSPEAARGLSKEGEGGLVATTVEGDAVGIPSLQSVDAMVAALESWNDLADQLLVEGDNLLSNIENFKKMDEVEYALAHMRSMDIDVYASTTELARESGIAAGNEELDLMSVAGTMINDIDARNRVVERLKDKVLDFLLGYIPTININSLDGVYENISYHISSLDLSGFRFQKDEVFLDIDQDPLASDGSLLRFKASGIEASFKGVEWKYAQLVFPNLQGEGLINAAMERASLSLGFKLTRVPKGTTAILGEGSGISYYEAKKIMIQYPMLDDQVKRILRQREAEEKGTVSPVPLEPSSPRVSSSSPVPPTVAAEMGTANLLPPGPPSAPDESPNGDTDDVKKEGNPWGDDVHDWEPVLLINELDIVIDEFDTSIEQDGLSWIYNFLVALFKGVLKDRIAKALVDLIAYNSAYLLLPVNATVTTHWATIRQYVFSDFDVSNLPVCSSKDFMSLVGPEPDLAALAQVSPSREWNLKFSEDGSMGLKLDVLTNSTDQSHSFVVSGVAPDSLADKAIEAVKLESSLFLGSSLVCVNGMRTKGLKRPKLQELLKAPRPLYLQLRLADDAYAKVKERTQREANLKALTASPLDIKEVQFGEGPLGLALVELKKAGILIVKALTKDVDGAPGQAEKAGLEPGMIMLALNSSIVFSRMNLDQMLEIITKAPRPVSALFARSPDFHFTISAKDAKEVILIEHDGHVIVANDRAGGRMCQPYDCYVIQVNKVPVRAISSFTDAVDAIMATDPRANVRIGLRNFLAHAALEHIRARLNAQIGPVE